MIVNLVFEIILPYPQESIIQIKYGLPYSVTYPSMSTDPGSLNPGTRRSRVPRWWDPGVRTNNGAADTVLANHYSSVSKHWFLKIILMPLYRYYVSEGGGEWQLKSGDL